MNDIQNTHKITAPIIGVGKTQTFGEKGFQVRKVWLDVSDKPEYPTQAEIEFHQNNVALLDGLSPGDMVTITFALEGRKWEKDGKKGFFPKARGWAILKGNPQPQPANVIEDAQVITEDDLPF